MAISTRREFLRASVAATAVTAPWSTARSTPAGTDFSSLTPPQQTIRVNHDLHTHTVYSDGAHPIPLHILEARAFELDAVAITDHYTPGGRIYNSEAEFDRYIAEIERERSAQHDTIVLKGAEATALDTAGRISIDKRHASRLEWILCDLGGQSEGALRNPPGDKQKYVENVVRTYLSLCDVEYLNAIAHPFNTGNTTPAAFPEDYPPHLLRELAAKMADKGKVFDVMNDMIYWFHKASIAPRELTSQYVDLVKLFASVRSSVSGLLRRPSHGAGQHTLGGTRTCPGSCTGQTSGRSPANRQPASVERCVRCSRIRRSNAEIRPGRFYAGNTT